MEIILKVQPSGKNRFRLALTNDDIQKIHPESCSNLKVKLFGEIFEVTDAIITYKTYGTLNSVEINEWIIENQFSIKREGCICKLIFSFSKEHNVHLYTFYPNQARQNAI